MSEKRTGNPNKRRDNIEDRVKDFYQGQKDRVLKEHFKLYTSKDVADGPGTRAVIQTIKKLAIRRGLILEGN